MKGFNRLEAPNGFFKAEGIENLWSVYFDRLGPAGMALGRVKMREKTAKMEMLTRRKEMRLVPMRGSGRPNIMCCLGMMGELGVIDDEDSGIRGLGGP